MIIKKLRPLAYGTVEMVERGEVKSGEALIALTAGTAKSSGAIKND